MTATFQIIVNGIRTANEGGLTNVIKQVSWTLKGTQEGQSFELPQETNLNPVDPENFTELSAMTGPGLIESWLETAEVNMSGIKAHIQLVLDKECAKASLTSAAMPWAPAPEPSPAPAP
jgi:hypothetical protein